MTVAGRDLLFLAHGCLGAVDHTDVDEACKDLVKRLGAAGFLRHCIPRAFGGTSEEIDSRVLCIMRETLAYADGLADFAFAMQGLGAGAISLAGSDELKALVLPKIAKGELIAGFALTEVEAGSDVAAMKSTPPPTRCRAMWQSSWTATAAGPRSACCRA